MEKENARLHEAKQAELDRALAELYARKNIIIDGSDYDRTTATSTSNPSTVSAAAATATNESSSSSDGENFLGKLIMRVADSIIVNVSGVHIRYEEELDDSEGYCSSYGIYVKEFKLASNETMSTEHVTKRVGSLTELSAYVVPQDRPVTFEDTAEFIQKMTHNFPRTVKNESPYNTDYVLYPTSGRIEVNNTPLTPAML